MVMQYLLLSHNIKLNFLQEFDLVFDFHVLNNLTVNEIIICFEFHLSSFCHSFYALFIDLWDLQEQLIEHGKYISLIMCI